MASWPAVCTTTRLIALPAIPRYLSTGEPVERFTIQVAIPVCVGDCESLIFDLMSCISRRPLGCNAQPHTDPRPLVPKGIRGNPPAQADLTRRALHVMCRALMYFRAT